MQPARHSKEQGQWDSECSTTSWQRWCRLCAKEDPEANIDIFCKSEQNGLDATLATAIGKYFWVNIKSNDEIPKYLCQDCHTLVTSLISFTERVNKVQAMFCMLQNTKMIDPNELRVQYGLLDEDRQHIIRREPNQRNPTHSIEEQQDVDDEIDEEELWDEEEHVAIEEVHIQEKEDVGEQDEEFSFEFADEEATQLKRFKKSIGNSSAEGDGDGDGVGDGDGDEEVNEPNEEGDEEEEEEDDNDDEENGEDDDEAEKSLDDDVEDCDLYKELKFKVDDEEAAHSDGDVRDEDALVKHVVIEAMEEVHEDDDEDEEVKREVAEEVAGLEQAQQKRRRVQRRRPKPQHRSDEEPPVKRRRGRPSKYSDDPIIAGIKQEEQEADSAQVFPTIYECSICTKKYKNMTSYRKHMIDGHNAEPDIPEYMCDKCDKTFPSERQLAVHARNHLPLEDKLDVPCPYCDKKFTKVSVMRQHISGTHFQEKPFICDKCGRALKTLAALNEHKLVHTNDCPFECEICGKRFKNKPRLKVHTDTHTETSYMCTECGMHLNTRRTLKMHMLVHSDSRQYKCDFCGNQFKRSKALKNHLILHTGLRPYKCNFCGKTFSNGSNCRSHKKKSHPQELAEEEARGIKMTPTIVPKLEELRAGQNVVERPRQVKRHSGGLSAHMRAILIAAEEREKRQSGAGGSVVGEDSTNDSNFPDGASAVDLPKYTFSADGADDDEDEEETVIYEIIDEI